MLNYTNIEFPPHVITKLILTCANQTRATITGLLPYRRYGFTVAAFTVVGKSNFSEEMICTTEETGQFIATLA